MRFPLGLLLVGGGLTLAWLVLFKTPGPAAAPASESTPASADPAAHNNGGEPTVPDPISSRAGLGIGNTGSGGGVVTL